MRRYDDPVEVRRGPVGGPCGGPDDADGFTEEEGPEQFLWRGRLWKVRSVVAHWVETAPWWQSAGVRAVVGSDEAVAEASSASRDGRAGVAGPSSAGDLLVEREVWRVHAGRGGPAGADGGGVFDLSFDWSDGRWLLVGCVD